MQTSLAKEIFENFWKFYWKQSVYDHIITSSYQVYDKFWINKQPQPGARGAEPGPIACAGGTGHPAMSRGQEDHRSVRQKDPYVVYLCLHII